MRRLLAALLAQWRGVEVGNEAACRGARACWWSATTTPYQPFMSAWPGTGAWLARPCSLYWTPVTLRTAAMSF